MFKKALKVLTTLSLLTGCYFGYVHVFAIVVVQLKASKHTDILAFRVHDSKSLQDSIRFAEEVCGPHHWATDKELAYRYYNAERGYWIYAKECIRVVDEDGVRYDGKRMRMKPFLLITKSRDGKNTKLITADRAVFDLNAPLGFDANSGREPLKIKHAHLEPNVVIRDDKGTPHDPSDDMYTEPIRTVDYEESSQQITTELDTHVVMRERGNMASGDGLIIHLRKPNPADVGGSASGFDGVEKLVLLKNVHVVLPDVGNSGMVPGSASAKKSTPKQLRAQTTAVTQSTQNPQQPAQPTTPVPLDLTCDSKMQVFLPKTKLPVVVGPPELPLPTRADFERNVVVLRGDLKDRPDQLTCDTLKLTLLPGDKPALNETSNDASKPKPRQSGEVLAQGTALEPKTPTASGVGSSTNQDTLGGLTLQRLHATGHAVWLILPVNGIKLRCNEMIHARRLPLKPDMTYFRGDRTRPVEIVKIDLEQPEDKTNDDDDSPQEAKVVSVTNIWTEDATLLDSGTGTDTADIYAHGPGRLETRPDRDQPVDRIAIWQDTLIVKNVLGPNNEVLHKVIDLTGSRPCFIDNQQQTSLDSASWIQVWLKPKPAPPKALGEPSKAIAQQSNESQNSTNPVALVSSEEPTFSPAASEFTTRKAQGDDTTENGNLQIEQLHALIDVHLLAPSKTLTAREKFDADFVEVVAPLVVGRTTNTNATTGAPTAMETGALNQANTQGSDAITLQEQADKPSDDPPMTGSCNRLWAKIELKPAPNETTRKRSEDTRTAAAKPRSGETNTEIRKAWLCGNVALHQDAKPEDVKSALKNGTVNGGTDASGEAVYLDNRGPNLVISYVYQRDPTDRTRLPGPLPPACVDSKDKDPKRITAAGSIEVNQEIDQAKVTGPGTVTQLAARAFLSDKSPASDEGETNTTPGSDGEKSPDGPDAQIKIRSTSMVKEDVTDQSVNSKEKAGNSKPKMRAGIPLSEKVPMTIGFSERMEFTGRTVDPEQRPAARADFHGVVTARMEDGLLHCKSHMIFFTDREVPLTQVGNKNQKQSGANQNRSSETEESEPEPQAELTLVYCYLDAIGISRKVDPDYPEPIQQQRIEADKILAYDRRTGDFFVDGKGKVFLFDRDNGSSSTQELGTEGRDNPGDSDRRDPKVANTEQTITETSGVTANRSKRTTGKKTTVRPEQRAVGQPERPGAPRDGEPPALVLTQIHFNNGMQGRFGTGKENDKTESRWSEFHGNVETCRAKVANTDARLNLDYPPEDAVYLTGQILRVIQEPPPVGSPESTPARQYLKVWENAQARNHTKIIKADVITYDSYKDLVYAYGEDGHPVLYAEQHAAGQPVSYGSAEAVQLNPKTGEIHLINSNTVGLIDKNTGYRPTLAGPDDPYAKKKKPIKKPFRLPTMNVERRGWTGT